MVEKELISCPSVDLCRIRTKFVLPYGDKVARSPSQMSAAKGVVFVKLELLKRPYLFLLFFRFRHVSYFLSGTNSIISRILLSVYLQIRCSCKLANLQGCLCRLQHLKEL